MLKITTNCEQKTLRGYVADIETQVTRIAKHLGIKYQLFLSTVESRKGSSHTQGLRAQSYTSDGTRPAVLLLFHPASNDTCWLWRVQFPPGTDVALMFGKFGIAIEKGYHLVDTEEGLDEGNQPSEHTNGADRREAELLASVDSIIGDSLIAAAILEGLHKGLEYGKTGFTDSYVREHICAVEPNLTTVVDLFIMSMVSHKYLVHDKEGGYSFGPAASALLEEHGIELVKKEPPPPPPVRYSVSEGSQTTSLPSLRRPMITDSRDWSDEESPADRAASEKRVATLLNNADQVAFIMRHICSHGEWSEDEYPVLARKFVLDKVVQSSRGIMQRRDAGRVLSGLVKRRYFDYFGREDDVLQINPSGVAMARACRDSNVPSWAKPFTSRLKEKGKLAAVIAQATTAASPTSPVAAPVPAEVSGPKMGPDYIRDLMGKTKKLEAAKATIAQADKRMGQIEKELAELDAKTAALKIEREKLEASLVEAHGVVADSQYIAAAEELASVKAVLGIK